MSCVSITVHLDAGETAVLRGYVSAVSPPAQVYGNTTILMHLHTLWEHAYSESAKQTVVGSSIPYFLVTF